MEILGLPLAPGHWACGALKARKTKFEKVERSPAKDRSVFSIGVCHGHDASRLNLSCISIVWVS